MSSHKEEEAKRAIDVAEKKLSENDYVGAKKFAYKAQSLHPNLDGLKQVLIMIDVYISASKKTKGEPDWYGILGVDPTADDEAVKRQYKKLALLIHPDKNRFNGAEGATKLVLEAWSVLSDNAKRSAYDLTRKSKKVKKKPSNKPKPEPEPESYSYPEPEADSMPDEFDLSFRTGKDDTFWTMCDRCKTYCQFGRNNNLNKTLLCPNCSEDFVATEIPLEKVNNRLIIRFSFFNSSTSRSTSDDTSSTSASESAKAAHYERMKRWFEPELYPYFNEPEVDIAKPDVAAAAGGDAKEEERLFKKMETGNPNSCSAAESLFEKPMTSGDADSSLEAERLFKKMATGNANSSSGAESLFEKPTTTGDTDSTLEAERLFKKPMTNVE